MRSTHSVDRRLARWKQLIPESQSGKVKAVDVLRGNTLRVYLFLVRHGEAELKEVQKELGLSSPSLASYHLSKLIAAGYVEQTAVGRYRAFKDASPEVLEGYTKMGAVVVPQLLFLSLLFTILVAYFSFQSMRSTSFLPLLIAVSGAAVVALWYETYKLWRRLVTWS